MLLWQALLDLIVLLAAAMVLGAVMERLKQSAVVGFMLAGVLLSPNTQSWFGPSNEELIQQIAQFGVILLMFTIGLEFSFSRLKTMGVRTLLAGVMQIGLTTAFAAGLGMLISSWFGDALSVPAAFAIGAALSLSSTGVVVPALQKQGQLDSVHGRFSLGILLVQDAAVVPLVLIVGALAGGGTATQVVTGTLQSFVVVALFMVVSWLFTKYVMPAMVRFAPPSRNREVPIVFGFVAAMGAAWAANSYGLSAALGAFLAAIFLGESLLASQLRTDLGPFKSVFVTLFFASIGMLADVHWAASNLPLVLGVTAIVVIGKPLTVSAVGILMRLPVRHSVAAGVCMCQIGVFSFVLADIAYNPPGLEPGQAGLIGVGLFNLVVAVTILALFATPYAVALAPAMGGLAERRLRKIGLVRDTLKGSAVEAAAQGGHVIVVGYGPAGRAVAEALRAKGAAVAVADLNPRSVMEARKQGMKAQVGDASQPGVLKLLGVEQAGALVVTLPDHRLTLAVIVEAKALVEKGLTIVARSRYSRYSPLLRAAGADVVIDEEDQVGKEMGRQVTAVPLLELESAVEADPEPRKK